MVEKQSGRWAEVERLRSRAEQLSPTCEYPLRAELAALAAKIAREATDNHSTWGLPQDLFTGYFQPVTHDGKCFEQLCRTETFEDGRGPEISLAKDIIVTRPWDSRRLADATHDIGPGRALGPWREDPGNHIIELWMPLRLGWVISGNHSIAVGIQQKTGIVHAYKVRWIEPALNELSFFGTLVFRRSTKKYLGHINSVALAAALAQVQDRAK